LNDIENGSFDHLEELAEKYGWSELTDLASSALLKAVTI